MKIDWQSRQNLRRYPLPEADGIVQNRSTALPQSTMPSVPKPSLELYDAFIGCPRRYQHWLLVYWCWTTPHRGKYAFCAGGDQTFAELLGMWAMASRAWAYWISTTPNSLHAQCDCPRGWVCDHAGNTCFMWSVIISPLTMRFFGQTGPQSQLRRRFGAGYLASCRSKKKSAGNLVPLPAVHCAERWKWGLVNLLSCPWMSWNREGIQWVNEILNLAIAIRCLKHSTLTVTVKPVYRNWHRECHLTLLHDWGRSWRQTGISGKEISPIFANTLVQQRKRSEGRHVCHSEERRSLRCSFLLQNWV